MCESIEKKQDVMNRFWTSREGSLLPMFAFSLVPLLAVIGAAVDLSDANKVRSELQAALDTAILAGAKNDSAIWATTAANAFAGSLASKGSSVRTPEFTLNGDGSFSGSVSASVPMSFMRAAGVSSMTVNVQSTAMVAPTSPGAQYCLLALNLTASPSVKVSGNGAISISAPSCVMQVNSNSSAAVDLSGNASVSTTDNCVAGTVHKADHSSLAPPPDAVCKTLPDPFSNYTKPSVGNCDYTNYSLSGGNTVTLYPGVYCGGMSFSGSVNVTFAPDPNNSSNNIFIIKDGAINESGGKFTGNGVTLLLTGSGAGIQMSGQADWHLVAPVSGPMAGFAIFLDPNGPSGAAATSSQLSGQSELYFEGVVYLPTQLVTITGSAEAFAPSPWTSFVADTFQITGNGGIVINNNTSLTSVPIPTGLKMRTGGRLWLMQ